MHRSINRYSFAVKHERHRPIMADLTRGNEDQGFRDIAELYGVAKAWECCIAQCEQRLAAPSLSPRERHRLEIALMNARGQLALGPQ